MKSWSLWASEFELKSLRVFYNFLGTDLKNAIAESGDVIEEIDFNNSNYADLIDPAYAYWDFGPHGTELISLKSARDRVISNLNNHFYYL